MAGKRPRVHGALRHRRAHELFLDERFRLEFFAWVIGVSRRSTT
ncbi:MAG: hypothetical protein ACLSDQ_14765 [Adlercreutzia equolifaciens]